MGSVNSRPIRAHPCVSVDRLRFLLLLLLALPLFADASLDQSVARLKSKHKVDSARVGLCVVDLDTGKEVLALDAQQPLAPASNMKLVTTAAAIERLGADFEYHTILYRKGAVDASGTLKGDLAVIGAGDPNVSGRFFDGDPAAVFKQWADKLREAGVKSVEGDLLLDDTLFDQELTAPDWPKDQLTNWYCAQVTALPLNDACIDISVRPGARAGQPARVILSPDTKYVTIENACTTTAVESEHSFGLSRIPGTNRIRVTGKVLTGSAPDAVSVTVHDPTMFFGTVLAETLRAKGIALRGTPKRVERPLRPKDDGLDAVCSYAVDLKRTIAVTNKRSQNFYAESLLKLLGARAKGQGSWATGASAVSAFLDSVGAAEGEFVVTDGCGLSSTNRLSARTLARVLAYEWGRPHRDAYVESLAQGGEGTLEKRLRDGDLEGRVRAKTGYIAGASALSGYVQTPEGRWLAYSILVNRFKSLSDAKAFQDDVVRLLARGK